jgi:hypothetical protein
MHDRQSLRGAGSILAARSSTFNLCVLAVRPTPVAVV